MIAYKARLKASIHDKLKAVYPVELADLDMTPTPDPKMGDLALTFPFQLAKKLRKAPGPSPRRSLALLASVEGVVKAEVAGGGFINLWLDKAAVFAEAVRSAGRTSLAPEERKIIVEHTNINPNKAAHIGHLRNAVLGDTLVRCCDLKGETVEVQNYIDDTGVQVVDVVFGLHGAREEDDRRPRGPRPASSTTTAGTSTPASPPTSPTTPRPRPARPRSTSGSSTATTPRRPVPRTSPGASSGPTWPP